MKQLTDLISPNNTWINTAEIQSCLGTTKRTEAGEFSKFYDRNGMPEELVLDQCSGWRWDAIGDGIFPTKCGRGNHKFLPMTQLKLTKDGVKPIRRWSGESNGARYHGVVGLIPRSISSCGGCYTMVFSPMVMLASGASARDM